MPIRLSKTLALPDEIVTETVAILGKRGSGKTNTAAVMVEGMLEAGLPVVVLDPIGAWWGLRAGSDGKPAGGLPITILGGDHGDAPLSPDAGEQIADLVVAKRCSLVLDLSAMESRAEMSRFVTAFARRLYHKNRDPLHLVLEEADQFAPQRYDGGQAKMVGAIDNIARRGRQRGLGFTLICQRTAKINKDALSQCEVMLCMKLVATQDRAAIDEWVKHNADTGQREEFLRGLASLKPGEGWVWSPGLLGVFERVQVDRRRTYDSSATPKLGKRAKPAKLRDVDFEALRADIEKAKEEAEASDPKKLRAKIAELERELAKATTPTHTHTHTQAPDPRVERMAQAMRLAGGMLAELLDSELSTIDQLGKSMAERAESAMQAAERVAAEIRRRVDEIERNGPDASKAGDGSQAALESGPARGRERDRTVPAPARTGTVSTSEAKILDALSWWESIGLGEPTRLQVGFVAGYKAGGGRFSNLLGAMRSSGWIDYPGDGRVSLTEPGRALARRPSTPPSLGELHDRVLAQLPPSEAKVLRAVIDSGGVTREKLGELTDYSAGGGRFSNILGRLRSLGLITYGDSGRVWGSDLLFPTQLTGVKP